MDNKRKLSNMLLRVATELEANYGLTGDIMVPEMPAPLPIATPDFIRDQTGPHGQGAGPGKGQGCGQVMEMEGDSEIYELQSRVINVLNNYGVVWEQPLVEELVGLIEQHEVEEFPEHLEEPLSHLEGKPAEAETLCPICGGEVCSCA